MLAALINLNPVPGKLKTLSVTIPAVMRDGNERPTKVAIGIKAFRSMCLKRITLCDRPLAFAVLIQSWARASIALERMYLVNEA